MNRSDLRFGRAVEIQRRELALYCSAGLAVGREVRRGGCGGQACGARRALNSAGWDSQELNSDSPLSR